MATVYFDKRDYRADQQSPWSAARSHAVARKLCGLDQNSKWYGAHYWAACALLSHLGSNLGARLSDYRKRFTCEITGGNGEELPRPYLALWRLAVRRVRRVRAAAIELPTSTLW